MEIKVRRKLVFWYWRLDAKNGQTIATSEVYYSRGSAMRTAKKLSKAINVPIEDKI